MATFNVSNVAVRADGWSADVTLEGQAGQQGNVAYDFGTPGAIGISSAYFLVTSMGFDASGNAITVERYVYFTKAVRKPSPNEAQLDETDNAGNLVVRVALSDYVYDPDHDDGLGSSGVELRCVIQSGTFTIGANTNAALNNSATNGSTVAYPKPVCQWARPLYQALRASFEAAIVARHRHGIAGVVITATDASAGSVSGAATAVAALRATSELYVHEYQYIVALDGLAQGDVVTLRAQVYPKIGDSGAVFDTNNTAESDDARSLGQCNYSFYCDKTGAAKVTRYVSTTGNDTTGDGSSGTPWATIEKALSDGNADDIEVAAGTYTLGTVTAPASISRWRVVRAAAGATVTLQLNGGKAYNTPHLKLENIRLLKTVQGAWLDGSNNARYLWLDGCTLASNATGSPTVGPAYRSACCFMTGSIVEDAKEWGLDKNFAARLVYWIDGCSLAGASSGTVKGWTRFVGNDADDVGLGEKGSTTGPLADPAIVEFNKMHSWSSTGEALVLLFKTASCAQGFTVSGNILEGIAGTAPVLQISADSALTTTKHGILWQNTFAGERCNLAYNETGTVSYAQDLWSVVGNSFEEYNIKSDRFGTPSGTRVGNWPVLYGVGFVANGAENTIGFCNAFEGLYSASLMGTTETESATTPCSPMYVDDQSFTTAGTGDGDYEPDVGSDLLDGVPTARVVLAYDALGTPFAGEIGAVQIGGAGGAAPGIASALFSFLAEEDEENLLANRRRR